MLSVSFLGNFEVVQKQLGLSHYPGGLMEQTLETRYSSDLVGNKQSNIINSPFTM